MTNEPEVSVPAVMRNYHEVLRNDLAKVLAPLAAAGDLARFAPAWETYRKAIAVHAAMEDGVEGAGGGSTAMLDHYFDGAAGSAVFKAEHVQEHACQHEVTTAIGEGPDAGFEHFVAHGVDSLATHGSTKNPPAAPAPVWKAIVAEVPSLEGGA